MIAAAVRKSPIGRRVHAERAVEATCCEAALSSEPVAVVDGDRLVIEGSAEPAAVDGHLGRELVLRADGVLPVVAAHAPAVQHGGIGRRRRRDVLAEVDGRRRVRELVQLNRAVRPERRAVHVPVRPRPRIGQTDRRLGVAAIGRRDLLARDVAGEARLDRCLAIAEHVEGHAEARAEVLPVLHAAGAVVLQIVHAIRAIIEAGRRVPGARRKCFRQRCADELVVAETRIDRRPPDGPPILGVDARIRLDRIAAIGRNTKHDRHGRARVVVDLLDVAIELLHQPPPALGNRPTELEGMRSRDERRRERLGEQLRKMIRGIVPRV